MRYAGIVSRDMVSAITIIASGGSVLLGWTALRTSVTSPPTEVSASIPTQAAHTERVSASESEENKQLFMQPEYF